MGSSPLGRSCHLNTEQLFAKWLVLGACKWCLPAYICCPALPCPALPWSPFLLPSPPGAEAPQEKKNHRGRLGGKGPLQALGHACKQGPAPNWGSLGTGKSFSFPELDHCPRSRAGASTLRRSGHRAPVTKAGPRQLNPRGRGHMGEGWPGVRVRCREVPLGDSVPLFSRRRSSRFLNQLHRPSSAAATREERRGLQPA